MSKKSELITSTLLFRSHIERSKYCEVNNCIASFLKKPKKRKKRNELIFILEVFNLYEQNLYFFKTKDALYRYVDHEYTQSSELTNNFILSHRITVGDYSLQWYKDDLKTERQVRKELNI